MTDRIEALLRDTLRQGNKVCRVQERENLVGVEEVNAL